MCCGCDTSYIASVHIQCQASIYTLSLCRGHSWRVRLAKQKRRWLLSGTWSHLWFAGVRECPPWCSIVGATVTVHQFFCILHCHKIVKLCWLVFPIIHYNERAWWYVLWLIGGITSHWTIFQSYTRVSQNNWELSNISLTMKRNLLKFGILIEQSFSHNPRKERTPQRDVIQCDVILSDVILRSPFKQWKSEKLKHKLWSLYSEWLILWK